MRKDQHQLLDKISKIQRNQLYLLETPKTPQQEFLHLFAHRHLVRQKMLNKNIDAVINQLEGSFGQVTLKLIYTILCVQNQIELPLDYSPLVRLIQGWINYFPSLHSKSRLLLTEIVVQQQKDINTFGSFEGYLHYLNTISIDLWKLVRKSKSQAQMFAKKQIKEELKECSQTAFPHLQINDLLTFISSCIPKVLLNIILQKDSFPPELRKTVTKFQCLYSNQNIQYILRTSIKLSFLLRQLMIILLTLQLNPSQQKFLMLICLRYYYTYHYDNRFNAAELIIYTFNKLDQEIRKGLYQQFALFFKIVIKLGKDKFVNFISKNSAYLNSIIEIVNKRPLIGYPQQSASPYNTFGIGQSITIERGATTIRTFQVLEDYSIFYVRLIVSNLDINLRLTYLGQITSPKVVKTLLITHQRKSGEIKLCINAIKKGLYQFEFDNSYSWINAKTLIYQVVVFTPLQIKSQIEEEWLGDYYQNIYQNQITNQQNIYVVPTKQPAVAAEVTEMTKIGTVQVDKNGQNLKLTVNKKNEQYVYECDNPERFQQKIKQIVQSKQVYKWTLLNKVVHDLNQIDRFIRGIQNPTHDIKEYQVVKQGEETEKQEPILKQGEDNEEEYQVVQREVQKSQIITDNIKREEATSKTQLALKNQKQVKNQVKKEVKKSVIECNYEQTEQFYEKTEK